jgi:hypothetical protein
MQKEGSRQFGRRHYAVSGVGRIRTRQKAEAGRRQKQAGGRRQEAGGRRRQKEARGKRQKANGSLKCTCNTFNKITSSQPTSPIAYAPAC